MHAKKDRDDREGQDAEGQNHVFFLHRLRRCLHGVVRHLNQIIVRYLFKWGCNMIKFAKRIHSMPRTPSLAGE